MTIDVFVNKEGTFLTMMFGSTLLRTTTKDMWGEMFHFYSWRHNPLAL